MLNRDFERVAAGLKPLAREFVTCEGCGSQWFNRVQAVRLDVNQLSNLAQQPAESGGPFYLLQCLRCNDLQDPPLVSSQMSPLRAEYDEMLDQVADGKGDTRNGSDSGSVQTEE